MQMSVEQFLERHKFLTAEWDGEKLTCFSESGVQYLEAWDDWFELETLLKNNKCHVQFFSLNKLRS